jgi:hypothetical protein
MSNKEVIEKLKEKGEGLVKKALVKEWTVFVEENAIEFVEIVVNTLKLLSRGEDLEKIEEKLLELEICPYQYKSIIEKISFFHPREKEIKDYFII